jgi:hypothetical protein
MEFRVAAMLAPWPDHPKNLSVETAACEPGESHPIVDVYLVIWVDKGPRVSLASCRSRNVTGYFNRVQRIGFVSARP